MSDPRLASKEWRINNLYKIKNKNKQLVKFKPNRAQVEFHNNKANRNIILKSRQLGMTTFEAIDSLDDTLFNKNTDAMMLSYDQQSQLDIFDNKIKLAWDNLHPSLQKLYDLDADRANKLKFNWGDGSVSSIAAQTHGRSGTFNRLHISEFAKICKNSKAAADEIISGNIPAVPIDGRIDIESTAEGDTGAFYDMFMEAWLRGEPETPVDFKAFFFNWTYDDAEIAKVKPLPDEKFPKEFLIYRDKHSLTQSQITYYYFKWIEMARDWGKLHQQYPTTVEEAFEYSGDKFFNAEKLHAMQTRDPNDDSSGYWKYFADYKPGHRYALAADPAGGFQGDNATIAIIDFDAKPRPELVATYVNDSIEPDMFAYEVKNGGTRYGNCIVAVERNNHGHATLAILKGIYYNIFKEYKEDTMTSEETEKLGWHTNRVSKPKMVFDMKTAIEEDLISIPDKETVHEMITYQREDVDNVKDGDGKHWDRVIALCIAWQMNKYAASTRVVTTGSDSEFDKFGMIASL